MRRFLGGLTLGTLALVLAAHAATDAGGSTPATMRYWPPFTMVYTEHGVDPHTGRVTVDRTHRLTVVDDYTWRDEVIRDAAHPEQTGSYRRMAADGTYTRYDAEWDGATRQRYEPRTIVGIAPGLMPGLYTRLRGGMPPGGGFREVEGPGRSAWVRASHTACSPRDPGSPPTYLTCPPGADGTVLEEERIEFDVSRVGDTYHDGITVFAERRVNGHAVRTLQMESLEFAE